MAIKFQLDPWQEEVINSEGNIALRSGRQVGKSTAISILAAEHAIKHPHNVVMIISSVERQANLLFEKTLGFLIDNYKSKIKSGRDRPTRHIINLTNGSRIYSLPTGMSGSGIRGYTVDLLIVDECAFVPEPVFQAITPMLAARKGRIVVLSTPFGKQGFFYNCFSNPDFKTFHIRSDECPRISKEYLESEKRRMTKAQFAQEYLGEFVDELRRFFSDDLIAKCCTVPQEAFIPFSIANNSSFMGVDIASLGKDESAFVSVYRDGDKLRMFHLDITTKTLLSETILRIKELDRQHDYKRIYIDSGGIGVGVTQPLLKDDQVKRKIVEINNAQRSINRDETAKRRLMKEDLYSNLLRLMEQSQIKLFDTPELQLSLKSVQYEYGENGQLKIWSNYGHCTEALVRAAWCMVEKDLNIWVRY